ncbi:3',5'-cyclic-AMP phosphodiesterase [Acinetobacter ursingii]|uniref:3',5'-cyclic-AMP phosphodiesterase n=1 Tax=Acinetobacter ursingii TaxID=108980 RepID=UPI001250AF23|nr:3',5'-cyclic-AMP phosphodiesterase [Acinetobacter ursingii]
MSFQVVPTSAQEYVLIQITDTHLLEQPEHEFVGMNPEQSFHEVMTHIQQHYPQADAIIHTGDLAQAPRPKTYQRYLHFMQQLGIPFFHTPGNHDDEKYFPFHQENPQQPVLIELGDWRIILLNTAVSNRVDGLVSTSQLEQLTNLLEQHQAHPTILACHHHPFEMHSKWIDQHKLKNSQAVFNLLERFKQVKAILYGHVHQNSSNFWQHIECLSTPSTSVQFKPCSEQFALDAVAPGYRVLKLKTNGTFETVVQRLEHINHLINTEISGY